MKLIAAGAVALILASACSTGELGGADPTATFDDVVKTRVAERNFQPTRTPIPTSTPFARRTPTILATAGPTNTPAPTSTPEPTPTANPFSAELAPVLLTTEDLPVGWRVSQEGVEAELTETDDICGVEVFDPAVADLVAGYEASATGPFASESISLYDGPDSASSVFSQLELAYLSCPPLGYDYGDGSSLLISQISFPPIGDESVAIRLSLGFEEFTFEVDAVIFRVDEVVAAVYFEDPAAIFGMASDPGLFENLVHRAAERIANHADYIDSINVPIQTI